MHYEAPKPTELNATIEVTANWLAGAWRANDEWFSGLLRNDPCGEWFASRAELKRAWGIAQGRRSLKTVPDGGGEDNYLALAKAQIARRLRLESEGGNPNSLFDNFDIWLRISARHGSFPRWFMAVVAALREYLYTTTAQELATERKNINRIIREAQKGLDALEALQQTYAASRVHTLSQLTRHIERTRIELAELAAGDLDGIYFLERADATVRERLLAFRLAQLHRLLFRVSKPEAIASVLDLPCIKEKLDLRTIERQCAKATKVKRPPYVSTRVGSYARKLPNKYRDSFLM